MRPADEEPGEPAPSADGMASPSIASSSHARRREEGTPVQEACATATESSGPQACVARESAAASETPAALDAPVTTGPFGQWSQSELRRLPRFPHRNSFPTAKTLINSFLQNADGPRYSDLRIALFWLGFGLLQMPTTDEPTLGLVPLCKDVETYEDTAQELGYDPQSSPHEWPVVSRANGADCFEAHTGGGSRHVCGGAQRSSATHKTRAFRWSTGPSSSSGSSSSTGAAAAIGGARGAGSSAGSNMVPNIGPFQDLVTSWRNNARRRRGQIDLTPTMGLRSRSCDATAGAVASDQDFLTEDETAHPEPPFDRQSRDDGRCRRRKLGPSAAPPLLALKGHSVLNESEARLSPWLGEPDIDEHDRNQEHDGTGLGGCASTYYGTAANRGDSSLLGGAASSRFAENGSVRRDISLRNDASQMRCSRGNPVSELGRFAGGEADEEIAQELSYKVKLLRTGGWSSSSGSGSDGRRTPPTPQGPGGSSAQATVQPVASTTEGGGLGPQHVDQFTVSFVSDSQLHEDLEETSLLCTFCLDDMQIGEELCRLPCMHTFHRCCIHAWLARDRRCMLCRLDVTRPRG